VPLHPKKLTQRGFNQSALLARFLSRKMQRPCDFSTLRRTRHGDAQVGKSKQERIRNMKTAFHVPDRRHDIAGRHILLVDDVVTTTATVRSAANALKIQGKAASVQVVCLGRAATRR
jgi:ComF family protein